MRLFEIRNNDIETLVGWADGVIIPRMRLVRTQAKEGKLVLSYRNQITRDLAIIVIDVAQQTMYDPDGFLEDTQSYADERSFKQALAQMVKSAEDIE